LAIAVVVGVGVSDSPWDPWEEDEDDIELVESMGPSADRPLGRRAAGDAVAITVLTTVTVRVAVDLISGSELVDRTAALHNGDIVETRPPAFGIGDTVNDPIGP
jgi:hypothetical protein